MNLSRAKREDAARRWPALWMRANPTEAFETAEGGCARITPYTVERIDESGMPPLQSRRCR